MNYIATGPITDSLTEGMEAIALVGEHLIRGSVITLEIIDYCGEARSFEEIAQHCRSVFGEPPSGNLDELVGAALNDLCDAEVLTNE